MLDEPSTLIMSVAEFRLLTGSDTATLSDEQITDIIRGFDLLAIMHIKGVAVRQETPKE